MELFPQTSIPLLAFAAGDAFGVYYEFLEQTSKEIPQVMMSKTGWPFGGVSDDTFLSILTIRSLEKESPEEAAEFFLAELRRSVPRLRGLGPTTRTALGLEVKPAERGIIGEIGLSGHWIKLLLHYMFIYKAKARPGWAFIPE